MRYCEECGTIFEDEGDSCPDCGCKTIDIGLKNEQLLLFDDSDLKQANRIYEVLKRSLATACLAVSKAEEKVQDRIDDRNTALENLLTYDSFCKSKGVNAAAEKAFMEGLEQEGAQ